MPRAATRPGGDMVGVRGDRAPTCAAVPMEAGTFPQVSHSIAAPAPPKKHELDRRVHRCQVRFGQSTHGKVLAATDQIRIKQHLSRPGRIWRESCERSPRWRDYLGFPPRRPATC